MIKKIMEFLERIDADQLTFRKVGRGYGAHLNIQVEEMNSFNQNGHIMVTDKMLEELMNGNVKPDSLDDMTLDMLQNNYNYAMNDKSAFEEETCPNCGAQAGEYEVTMMGGKVDRNKRTCLRCQCTWFGYEWTAMLVTEYIKADSEKKGDMSK